MRDVAQRTCCAGNKDSALFDGNSEASGIPIQAGLLEVEVEYMLVLGKDSLDQSSDGLYLHVLTSGHMIRHSRRHRYLKREAKYVKSVYMKDLTTSE
jgi:hypothetical protein